MFTVHAQLRAARRFPCDRFRPAAKTGRIRIARCFGKLGPTAACVQAQG